MSRFVIAGPIVDDEQLYWSNDWGWGSRDGATIFDSANTSDIPLIEETSREPAP